MMERRRFLVLSSAAAVAFATRGASGSASAETLRQELPTSLDVAYCDGFRDSGGFATSRGSSNVVVAQDVTTGDPSFISRSARVKVHGMWRSQSRRDSLSITILAYYPTEMFAGGDVPVFVWNHVSRDSGDLFQPISFVIPIDEAGLRIGIEATVPRTYSSTVEKVRRRAVASGSDESRARPRVELSQQRNVANLSVGVARDSAKLRPGMYVLAMLTPAAPAPEWSNVRFHSDQLKAGSGPLTVHGVLGDTPVPFDYVVVEVDFAS
jgi:hypothetical protein